MGNEGYKLLSERYENNREKLEVECPRGHVFDITWNHFQRGSRCPECMIVEGGRKRRLTNFCVKSLVEEKGYELLSTYSKSSEKITLKCPENHIFETLLHNLTKSHGCPECARITNGTSKHEREIQEIVKSCVNFEVLFNDKKQILNPNTGYNLELDIWIPSLRKAIEFNGRYYHSFPEVKERDRIKEEQCKTKGIELLTIEEQNWLDNKNLCLRKIKEFKI